MAKSQKLGDAFQSARPDKVVDVDIAGEKIKMLLTWKDVREAARDWKTFSSDAPFRVPIPSEENVRTVRQLPIETDPPLHTAIRAQLEPWFRRASTESYLAALDELLSRQISVAKTAGETDFVREFALPVQSNALAILLKMPKDSADLWNSWGTHVFHDGASKGVELDDYIRDEIRAARKRSTENFFGLLTQLRIDGRTLSENEMAGAANLVFAGGRDTIINSISSIIVWCADHREELQWIAADQKRTNIAVEEFVRAVSPLTHIGRVCPNGASLGEHTVRPDDRISLCWAAANFDPNVFDAPQRIDPARSPNPHLGFGAGHHICLGAPHARAILRRLIIKLNSETREIRIHKATPQKEILGEFQRYVGYEEVIAAIQ